MRGSGAGDLLWYRDAIIYQVHVKTFADSNGDGIGDFPGLTAHLDYIASLGVTAIWLLPFFPSPRRDDGYDVADYCAVAPDYGTMDDVRAFIRAAHLRGIRVIAELVINHTSDQHPWFQRARRAAPGTVERDYYMWSDDDRKFAGTRIIFSDAEPSNWTWDDVAGAYYWHRFFHHQPDLNFDNPAVVGEVIRVLRFWADLGIDGFRLDAVQYLVAREGTSNSNLPETHAVLKRIRAELAAGYPDAMLLAEVNTSPAETVAYVAPGGCHMVFHFPLMARIYLALARGEAEPILRILEETPAIPDGTQWAIFLRNHDELTLTKLSGAERDLVMERFAPDPRARLHGKGIRRRLAPLMDNDGRRIRLLTSLLLTLPGTPVLYYGDEIGMGDLYLNDRDGVRTPMQWSPGRNGGFSEAEPGRLVLPVVTEPPYGHPVVNVEAQEDDTGSLLNWTRAAVRARQRCRAFGRGTFRPVAATHPAILAYLREYGSDTILCAANMSDRTVSATLDLQGFERWVVSELGTGLPVRGPGQEPWPVFTGPYGFYWFRLSAPG